MRVDLGFVRDKGGTSHGTLRLTTKVVSYDLLRGIKYVFYRSLSSSTLIEGTFLQLSWTWKQVNLLK